MPSVLDAEVGCWEGYPTRTVKIPPKQ